MFLLCFYSFYWQITGKLQASYDPVTSKLHKDFAIFLAYKKEREKKSWIFLFILCHLRDRFFLFSAIFQKKESLS